MPGTPWRLVSPFSGKLLDSHTVLVTCTFPTAISTATLATETSLSLSWDPLDEHDTWRQPAT
jgi:hypothetical protein